MSVIDRNSDSCSNCCSASNRLAISRCSERSLELLRRAGFRAEMVRAPCCGMAGAFGFEREHYEASRTAFHRALGPALEARPEARLAVVGISCRKQIEHFTGRPAHHLVELLRETAGPLAGDVPEEP